MLLVNALCMGQSIVCLPQIVTWLEGAYLISAASIPSSMMWLAYGTSSSTANGHMFHFYWREHSLLVISPVYRRIYPSVCCSVSFCILIVPSVYTHQEILTGRGMQHTPSRGCCEVIWPPWIQIHLQAMLKQDAPFMLWISDAVAV